MVRVKYSGEYWSDLYMISKSYLLQDGSWLLVDLEKQSLSSNNFFVSYPYRRERQHNRRRFEARNTSPYPEHERLTRQGPVRWKLFS